MAAPAQRPLGEAVVATVAWRSSGRSSSSRCRRREVPLHAPLKGQVGLLSSVDASPAMVNKLNVRLILRKPRLFKGDVEGALQAAEFINQAQFHRSGASKDAPSSEPVELATIHLPAHGDTVEKAPVEGANVALQVGDFKIAHR